MAKEIKETKAPDSLNATTKEVVQVKKEKAKKFKVKKPFRNAVTKTMQEVEDEIEVSDPDRVQALLDKDLIEE